VKVFIHNYHFSLEREIKEDLSVWLMENQENGLCMLSICSNPQWPFRNSWLITVFLHHVCSWSCISNIFNYKFNSNLNKTFHAFRRPFRLTLYIFRSSSFCCFYSPHIIVAACSYLSNSIVTFFYVYEFPCIISLYYIKNQQDATLAVLSLVTAGSLYMFRTLSASIVRSTENCSSSHWCMSWVGMIYIQ
jgi:hypothetical protein